MANQIYNRFKSAGKALKEGDVAVIDPAEFHYYQVSGPEGINTRYHKLTHLNSRDGKSCSCYETLKGLRSHGYWYFRTLVGAGLKEKASTRRPLASLIPSHLALIAENVTSFSPTTSSVTTTSGRTISYDTLVVATGLQINWGNIAGLPKALADPSSGVSSIYSYDTCDKVWHDIEALRSGRAIFTQPAGVVKCAGGQWCSVLQFGVDLFRLTCFSCIISLSAPQKIMWMAWDRYQQTKRGDNITIDFYTGMPTMFSVKKYSDELDKLRVRRGVGGHFQHNLVAVDSANRKATFKRADGTTVNEDYTLLHVTPQMGPLDVIKNSPIADEVGWVSIDKETLQHTKYPNIWALGDCSSAPTSKTAAAITAQAPVLTENLFSVVDTGKLSGARYDGYTSCPVSFTYLSSERNGTLMRYDVVSCSC